MRNEIIAPKVYVVYDDVSKDISVRDLVDQHNMPAFYTKSKRGLKKVWTLIQEEMKNPETTFSKIWNICSDNNIRTHSWYMMD